MTEQIEMTALRGSRPWQAPSVTIYGEAVELTAGGTGPVTEEDNNGNNGTMNKQRNPRP